MGYCRNEEFGSVLFPHLTNRSTYIIMH